ncbi:MAG: (d)CMP kinase [Candidatus Pelagibacterales bacterium]|tara:strand:- start:1734 stop:2363 length:630 start_codon:yes stop_codon:yes gene_type:complete
MVNIITVDGPAGVGKGTVCKLLAKDLDAKVLNSGEIFRTVAYYLKENNVDIENTTSVINSAENFEYKKISSNKLYSRDIDLISSKISMIPSLRKITIKIQKDFVKLNKHRTKTIIAEGRDMGTVIFPKADVKIFMWAKAEIRAKRRLFQINKPTKTQEYNSILQEILYRDMRDMSRKTAPLKPAEDSYLIDNSNLDIEQCFNRILKIIK